MKSNLIAVCLSCFLQTAFAADLTPLNFSAEGIKKIKISSPKGAIRLFAGSGSDKIKTTYEKIRFDEKCQESRTVYGTTLEITIESANKLFNSAHCEGKLSVEVPARAFYDIEISTGSASIAIEKVTGHMDLQTATGNATIDSEVLKNLSFKSATANLKAVFKKCEGRSDISLLTATGDSVIELPAHCKIRVGHKSATGDLFNELGESQDYQVMISSKSAGGQLTIKKNGK